MNKRTVGYYWVKFYNHEKEIIMFWNGFGFESFRSQFIHDEIESINENRITPIEG
jgi:hypothetical protein